MTEEIIIELLRSFPALVILYMWIKSERENHASDVSYYRNELSCCRERMERAVRDSVDTVTTDNKTIVQKY